MNRIRCILPAIVAAVIGGGFVFGTPACALAAFQIRATEFNSGGTVISSKTFSFANSPGDTVVADFSGVDALTDFVLKTVNNSSDTGPNFSSHSTTISVKSTNATLASSTKLLVEVLGDSYVNPTAPAGSFISSNGSPSTGGLQASSLVMTSGVISGNVGLDGTPGNILGGQFGMTTGTGSMGSSSSVLNPNPAIGADFTISNPFTFYQTYTFTGFSNTDNRSGSLSAGSEVAATPVPAGLWLVVSAIPLLGGCYLLRRRQLLQIA